MQQVVRRLEGFLGRHEAAVHQLNSEALVMIWGAFEVFATDTIRRRINLRPMDGVRLASEEPARRRINLKTVPFAELAELGFDMRNQMGDLVLTNVNLSSLETLKDIISVVLPGADELHRTLRNPELRRLWKRRNLIAHRGGIVDRAFLKSGVDDVPLGNRLIVKRAAIETSLEAVLAAAHALLSALKDAE